MTWVAFRKRLSFSPHMAAEPVLEAREPSWERVTSPCDTNSSRITLPLGPSAAYRNEEVLIP
jgi:hypothetical protein